MSCDWIKITIKENNIEVVFWCDQETHENISKEVMKKGVITESNETILCG